MYRLKNLCFTHSTCMFESIDTETQYFSILVTKSTAAAETETTSVYGDREVCPAALKLDTCSQ